MKTEHVPSEGDHRAEETREGDRVDHEIEERGVTNGSDVSRRLNISFFFDGSGEASRKRDKATQREGPRRSGAGTRIGSAEARQSTATEPGEREERVKARASREAAGATC